MKSRVDVRVINLSIVVVPWNGREKYILQHQSSDYCSTYSVNTNECFSSTALLAGTLRTMQRAACDEETVSLSCSRGTSISIQRAKYAETVPVEHICQSERLYPVTVEIVGKQNNCLWPNDMQVRLFF